MGCLYGVFVAWFVVRGLPVRGAWAVSAYRGFPLSPAMSVVCLLRSVWCVCCVPCGVVYGGVCGALVLRLGWVRAAFMAWVYFPAVVRLWCVGGGVYRACVLRSVLRMWLSRLRACGARVVPVWWAG